MISGKVKWRPFTPVPRCSRLKLKFRSPPTRHVARRGGFNNTSQCQAGGRCLVGFVELSRSTICNRSASIRDCETPLHVRQARLILSYLISNKLESTTSTVSDCRAWPLRSTGFSTDPLTAYVWRWACRNRYRFYEPARRIPGSLIAAAKSKIEDSAFHLRTALRASYCPYRTVSG